MLSAIFLGPRIMKNITTLRSCLVILQQDCDTYKGKGALWEEATQWDYLQCLCFFLILRNWRKALCSMFESSFYKWMAGWQPAASFWLQSWQNVCCILIIFNCSDNGACVIIPNTKFNENGYTYMHTQTHTHAHGNNNTYLGVGKKTKIKCTFAA